MSNDALAAFAEYQRSQDLAESTIRNRHSILRTFEQVIGAQLLDATIRELRAYVGRQGIKPGSKRTIRGALIAFYTFAQGDAYRDDNPALGLPIVRVPRNHARPFSSEQIDAMLASGAYRKTRAMILLGYYQGFRVSQIAAVHGRDIDFLSNTIRTVGKGGKEGLLPLSPVIAELAESMPRDDWWFPARGGRTDHISGASATGLITKAKERAGITDPNLTPHSLRHAFGTDLVEARVDIRVVQELMMHESLATTQIYTRVSEQRKREGLQALEARPIPPSSSRRHTPHRSRNYDPATALAILPHNDDVPKLAA